MAEDPAVESFRAKFRAGGEPSDASRAPPPAPPPLRPTKSALTCNLSASSEDPVVVMETKRPRYSAIAEQLGFLNDVGSERLLIGQAARTVDRLHQPLARQRSTRAPRPPPA